jgi:hypothetical protein
MKDLGEEVREQADFSSWIGKGNESSNYALLYLLLCCYYP